MATATYKILGVVSPTDTSDANLYTTASTATSGAVVSTIAVANRTASATTYRVFVRPLGVAATASNAIAYDVALAANDTVALTLGVTMSATDILTVRTASANSCNFFAFGSEIVA